MVYVSFGIPVVIGGGFTHLKAETVNTEIVSHTLTTNFRTICFYSSIKGGYLLQFSCIFIKNVVDAVVGCIGLGHALDICIRIHPYSMICNGCQEKYSDN